MIWLRSCRFRLLVLQTAVAVLGALALLALASTVRPSLLCRQRLRVCRRRFLLLLLATGEHLSLQTGNSGIDGR